MESGSDCSIMVNSAAFRFVIFVIYDILSVSGADFNGFRGPVCHCNICNAKHRKTPCTYSLQASGLVSWVLWDVGVRPLNAGDKANGKDSVGGVDEISQRLRALKKSWLGIKNAQHDLTYLGLPGKDRQYIEDVIDTLAQMAEQLESSHEDIQLMVRRSLEAQLGHAEAYFAKDMAENPSMRMLSFAAILQQMQRMLKSALAQSSSKPDSHPSANTT